MTNLFISGRQENEEVTVYCMMHGAISSAPPPFPSGQSHDISTSQTERMMHEQLLDDLPQQLHVTSQNNTQDCHTIIYMDSKCYERWIDQLVSLCRGVKELDILGGNS